jgi:hypothetical protein
LSEDNPARIRLTLLEVFPEVVRVAETLSPTEALIHEIRKRMSEGLQLNEQLDPHKWLTFQQSLADTLGLTEELTIVTPQKKQIDETASLGEALNRLIQRKLADQLAPTEALTRTHQPGAPLITGLDPVAGPQGTGVLINGSNFGATQGSSTVTFDGFTASINSWGATQISVLAPNGPFTIPAPVVVRVNGIDSNSAGFTYTK